MKENYEKTSNEYVQPVEEIRKVEGNIDYYQCDEEGERQNVKETNKSK